MRSEEEIEARIRKIGILANDTAEICGHGFPEYLTTYKGALRWVLEE